MAEKYRRILRPSLSIKVLEKIVAIILTIPRIIVQMLGFSDDPAVCKKSIWIFLNTGVGFFDQYMDFSNRANINDKITHFENGDRVKHYSIDTTKLLNKH